MLQFGRLLSFPLTFKQLTDKIKSINIQDINIIEKFNNTKKIKNFSIIRNKILYRSEYLFLDRKVYSINFKG